MNRLSSLQLPFLEKNTSLVSVFDNKKTFFNQSPKNQNTLFKANRQRMMTMNLQRSITWLPSASCIVSFSSLFSCLAIPLWLFPELMDLLWWTFCSVSPAWHPPLLCHWVAVCRVTAEDMALLERSLKPQTIRWLYPNPSGDCHSAEPPHKHQGPVVSETATLNHLLDISLPSSSSFYLCHYFLLSPCSCFWLRFCSTC